MGGGGGRLREISLMRGSLGDAAGAYFGSPLSVYRSQFLCQYCW
jgi:hypothetical protein